MVTLTYKHLFNDNFLIACHALEKTRFRDFKSPKNTLKILKAIAAESETAKSVFKTQFDPLFKKDEGGNCIPVRIEKDKNGRIINKGEVFSPFEVVEGKEEEYKQKFKEFGDTEFTVDAEKIDGDMILEVTMTPVMVGVLEDLFC